MTQEEKDRIIRVLQERGAILPCPRCGNASFALIDGYFNQSIQPQLNGGIVIGGPSIPSVAVICNRCGFISQHAAGALGLIPTTQKENSNETRETPNTTA